MKDRLSRIYRRFGGMITPDFIDKIETRIKKAGIRTHPIEWAGSVYFKSILLSIILTIGFILFNFENLEFEIGSLTQIIGIFFLGSVIYVGISYLRLYFKIKNRAQRLNSILPDFLLLIVSNLRAGLNPFDSFVKAARPEFGELNYEIRVAIEKVGTTGSLEDAMEETINYFDSPMYNRIVSLFGKGMNAGGRLTKLLKSSAEEVRRIQDLRAELITSTKMYSIFLGFIVIILMPFLLAVSIHFITMFIDIQEQVDIENNPSLGDVGTLGGEILITSD